MSTVAENKSAYAVLGDESLLPGVVVVRPLRPIASLGEASAQERLEILALIDAVRSRIVSDGAAVSVTVGFHERLGSHANRLEIFVVPHAQTNARSILELASKVAPTQRLIDSVDVTMREALLECLADQRYDRIDLVVSFIMRSGLDLLLPQIRDALDRNVTVRVLTTDYLSVTEPQALARLLDVAETSEGLTTRVFSHAATSFHPKAYIFRSSEGGGDRAFVGSSNLSRSGIDGGVEWSLAVDETSALTRSFGGLWVDPRTVALDHEWLARYRTAFDSQPRSNVIEPIGVEIEPPVQPVTPRPIQVAALDALASTRLEGHRAGLVVMATGLGKTWVAAFDSSRPQFHRALFVAHRDEILQQSLEAFRAVRPDADMGLYTGMEKQAGAHVVFASVQTLSRRLSEFERDSFDYVVVDEFHHAAASTYRRVLDHFEPAFLLGLTATPERMDGADLLALCGDNLVFQCDLVEGIKREQLVPFDYHGIADVVDYEPIPWRGGRFDPAQLAEAVETQERAEHAFAQWQTRRLRRTLAFCCTTAHADFMAAFFRDRGVAAAAVHTGATSAPRRQSAADLKSGKLEVLFAVDIFNEGFDLPELDTVLMLRPTDSPVIFLQQLGRGLRLADGKEKLTVVDLIGNHRAFLQRPRSLLSLCLQSTPTREQLREFVTNTGAVELPPGCSVNWDVGVVDFFQELLRTRGSAATDALRDYIRTYTDERGERPTAMQTFRAGLNPGAAGERGWFGLLDDLGVLTPDEQAAFVSGESVLRQVEVEALTRSFKLVTLRALLHEGTLRAGTTVDRVAEVSHQIVMSDPRVVADATAASTMPDPLAASDHAWRAYWWRNPLTALTASGKRTGDPLFRIEGGQFEPTFEVPEHLGAHFDELVAELVDYRLARYLLRPGADSPVIHLRVSHAGGRPILFLDRSRWPDTPEGWITAIADGQPYDLNFAKVAVNVARMTNGDDTNVLPELLRRWFGESAGHPGTSHAVTLRSDNSRWVIAPANVAEQTIHKLLADGAEIDASVSVSVDRDAQRVVVTVQSAGGTRGTPGARNLDYVKGVDLILERAQGLEMVLLDGYVDSERAGRLTLDERRLNPGAEGFPVSLGGVSDVSELRRSLLRSMGAVGRGPNAAAGSGNSRKRMSLVFEVAETRALDVIPALVLGQEERGVASA